MFGSNPYLRTTGNPSIFGKNLRRLPPYKGMISQINQVEKSLSHIVRSVEGHTANYIVMPSGIRISFGTSISSETMERFKVRGNSCFYLKNIFLVSEICYQIFQPVDAETEEAALKTAQVLVKTIYLDEEAAVEQNEDVQGLARDACEECINVLKEPEKSQARPATKILCAFMSTTRSFSMLWPDETLVTVHT